MARIEAKTLEEGPPLEPIYPVFVATTVQLATVAAISNWNKVILYPKQAGLPYAKVSEPRIHLRAQGNPPTQIVVGPRFGLLIRYSVMRLQQQGTANSLGGTLGRPQSGL